MGMGQTDRGRFHAPEMDGLTGQNFGGGRGLGRKSECPKRLPIRFFDSHMKIKNELLIQQYFFSSQNILVTSHFSFFIPPSFGCPDLANFSC